MLSQFKTYLMGGLAFLATLFFAFWKNSEASKKKMQLKAAEKEREIEQLGVEAAFRGLEREKEVRDEHKNADHSKRDFFE